MAGCWEAGGFGQSFFGVLPTWISSFGGFEGGGVDASFVAAALFDGVEDVEDFVVDDVVEDVGGDAGVVEDAADDDGVVGTVPVA